MSWDGKTHTHQKVHQFHSMIASVEREVIRDRISPIKVVAGKEDVPVEEAESGNVKFRAVRIVRFNKQCVVVALNTKLVRRTRTKNMCPRTDQVMIQDTFFERENPSKAESPGSRLFGSLNGS